MPQIEFGSLYKFAASVGLVLIFAAIALPWILLQSTGVLLISKKAVAGLPDSAGAAIQRRQLVVTWAQDNLPAPIFVVLALAGVSLLVWAFVKWAPSQKRSDASEQLALQKEEVEFQNLSRAEIDERLEEEVAETNPVQPNEVLPPATESETPTHLATPPPSSADAPTMSPDAAQEPDPAARSDGREAAEVRREQSRQLVAQLRATEDQVARLFQDAFEGAFKVVREVRITSGAARGRMLDIFLDPTGESRAQLGIEIKRLGGQILPDRLTDLMTRAAITTQDLSAGKVFTGVRGRPREAKASGVLVLVLNDEAFAANAFRIQRHVPIINSVMKRPVGVVLITQTRLTSIQSDELREAVASVWAEPDNIANLE